MAADKSEADQETTTENWNDNDLHLTVHQPTGGYLTRLSMVARVPLPPEAVFQILVDPENKRVFKAIKAVNSRRVLWSDGQRQLVEVEQVGQWRFLCFHGTFTTTLLVEEDKRTHSIRFELAKPGLMKRFQGTWRIEPFTQDSLDSLVNHRSPRQQGPLRSLRTSLHRLQDRLHGRHIQASLVQLEQSILPAFVPPPPTDRLFKRIAANQVRAIMGQLRGEADRLNQVMQLKGSHKGGAGQREGEHDPRQLSAHVRKL